MLCLEVTHVDAFVIPLNFFKARRDFVLSLQTLELVQTKNSMTSRSVRFSSRVLNLSSKMESKLLWPKNYQENVKTHKTDDSNYIFINLGSFIKKVTKSREVVNL